jgi:hypothetical protein
VFALTSALEDDPRQGVETFTGHTAPDRTITVVRPRVIDLLPAAVAARTTQDVGSAGLLLGARECLSRVQPDVEWLHRPTPARYLPPMRRYRCDTALGSAGASLSCW